MRHGVVHIEGGPDDGTHLVRFHEEWANPEYFVDGGWRVLPQWAHSDIIWFVAEVAA